VWPEKGLLRQGRNQAIAFLLSAFTRPIEPQTNLGIDMKAIFSITIIAMIGLSACDTKVAAPNAAADAKTDIQKKFPVTLSKIADGVWVHTSNYTVPGRPPIPSNGLIVADGDSLIMVDTAWGEMLTQSLLDTIKSDIGKPVTKVVITHHHPDRLAGVDVMEAYGAEVFTHPLTPIKALESGFPVPNTSVAALKEPKSRTKVGSVEVAYPGPAHAEENLVVYIPAQKILFGGCAIKGAQSNSMGNLEDADLKAWPDSLNWVKATYPETQTIVPGHGKGSDMRLIDKTIGMIAAKVNADAAKETETPAKP
jgi:metallo-beta-lactamase class B VIM